MGGARALAGGGGGGGGGGGARGTPMVGAGGGGAVAAGAGAAGAAEGTWPAGASAMSIVDWLLRRMLARDMRRAPGFLCCDGLSGVSGLGVPSVGVSTPGVEASDDP